MFDFDTYIANLENPNKIQRILMNIHEIKTKKIDDPVIQEDEIDRLFSSLFIQTHLCDHIDASDTNNVVLRYILCDGEQNNNCLMIWIDTIKGTIRIERYMSDCFGTWDVRSIDLQIDDHKHVVSFMNSFI